MGAPNPQVSSTMTSPVPKNHVVPQESLEATYTSLIQQYLQVMCLDNATFLAERMVATSKTTNSLYLLAICHYRNRSPQKALIVLEDVKETGDAATQYLTAKCCFDLDQFGRAEEALLQQARTDYKEYKATSVTSTTMDDWLMETSPCPVPNGAAGLYLLGNICRRSNRLQRASQYYRMSLQVSAARTGLFYGSLSPRTTSFLSTWISIALPSSSIPSCGLVTKLFVKWVPLISTQRRSSVFVQQKLISCKGNSTNHGTQCPCKRNPFSRLVSTSHSIIQPP